MPEGKRRKPRKLVLTPLAIVRVVEESRSYLKIAGRFGDNPERVEWLPLALLKQPSRFHEFIAHRFAYAIPEKESKEWRDKLIESQHQLPQITGTARVGWTPDDGPLAYGRRIVPDSAGVELIIPGGTMLSKAADALTPRGSREEQYREFRRLWDESFHFRLALSLACVSPFLEAIGSPSVLFHLAGRSGLGKTTLVRLGLSMYGDPFSSALCVDFSKDSKNYADALLGVMHNFPVLLDETTLRSVDDLAEAAYSIAVGHTRGRLKGPDADYAPASMQTYSLVCFMSGEQSIRNQMEHRGSQARFIEFPISSPLLPEITLPKWNRFAEQNHGWFGLDLLTDYIDPIRRRKLATHYQITRALTAQWCKDHARTVDFLALIQVGHRLAAARLGGDSSDKAAKEFAREVYAGLNRRTKLDDVLDMIVAESRLHEWVDRGIIPTPLIPEISKWKRVLEDHGLIVKTESRRLILPGDVQAKSVNCYYLSSEGRDKLLAVYQRQTSEKPATNPTESQHYQQTSGPARLS
jgi:hypothetical protein